VAPRTEALVVPIPRTAKLHRLEENIGAAGVEMTPEDLREVEAILGRPATSGRDLVARHAASFAS
jgi:diketogulonate reductase-like aldo/keto reductase